MKDCQTRTRWADEAISPARPPWGSRFPSIAALSIPKAALTWCDATLGKTAIGATVFLRFEGSKFCCDPYSLCRGHDRDHLSWMFQDTEGGTPLCHSPWMRYCFSFAVFSGCESSRPASWPFLCNNCHFTGQETNVRFCPVVRCISPKNIQGQGNCHGGGLLIHCTHRAAYLGQNYIDYMIVFFEFFF